MGGTSGDYPFDPIFVPMITRSPLLVILTLIGSMLATDQISAQEPASYKMEFVRAGWLEGRDGKKMVVAVFKITPLIEDFKMVLSMRLGYGFNSAMNNADVEATDKIKFAVFDNNVAEKAWKTYQLIKDRVDLTDPNIFLLQMRFFDLEEDNVEDMTIIYGLWEGENSEVRIEQEFNFHVEDLSKVPYERKE